MARKGLLSKSLDRTLSGDAERQDPLEGKAPSPAPQPVRARSGNPTVKRFKETFDELRGEAMQEVDTGRIGSSQYKDRFDVSSEIESLVASIEESGQQIPVLLRVTAPGSEFEYEPVYGRRRIAACRQLGMKVKAYITDIDDEQVIVAQGLENSERLENSYIEKAYFIAQLNDGGFTVTVISRAIGVQKSAISRMLSLVRNTPDELVTAIGPAHGIGRRQWAVISKASADSSPGQIKSVIKAIEDIHSSSDRFLHALKFLTATNSGAKKQDNQVVLADGKLTITKRAQAVNLKVKNKSDNGFIEWMIAHGEELYHQWKAQDELE